ncbi:MAG: STAS/SEC14 domain-containing protein [Promethearchaeota archaeon]|nr:MAG: STAS/SEC14 domain-containing protein [Candidatus Lokiarchaeota archaeon]
MYRLEKIGDNTIYLKATGTFPVEEAQKFVEEFREFTHKMDQYSVLVDLMDAILLSPSSFNIILDLLKKNNEKLLKSAFAICCNPPLNKEFQLLLKRAESVKRTIKDNLDEAKEWLGISNIIIKKDYST